MGELKDENEIEEMINEEAEQMISEADKAIMEFEQTVTAKDYLDIQQKVVSRLDDISIYQLRTLTSQAFALSGKTIDMSTMVPCNCNTIEFFKRNIKNLLGAFPYEEIVKFGLYLDEIVACEKVDLGADAEE